MRQDHFRGLLQETYNSSCRVFAPSPSIGFILDIPDILLICV